MAEHNRACLTFDDNGLTTHEGQFLCVWPDLQITPDRRIKCSRVAERPVDESRYTLADHRSTNGRDVMRAGCHVPRISISASQSATTSTDGERYASAMPWPSVGLKLPLVTLPVELAQRTR